VCVCVCERERGVVESVVQVLVAHLLFPKIDVFPRIGTPPAHSARLVSVKAMGAMALLPICDGSFTCQDYTT